VRTRSGWIRPLAVALLCTCGADQAASAAGVRLFPQQRSTGEKPQSKLFQYEGTFWAVLSGADSLGLYQREGQNWTPRTMLGAAGKADVKLVGSTAFVLVFNSNPSLHVLDHDSQSWNARAGSPFVVPKIHGSETLVLDQDSTGRLWYTGEGDGEIQVYYSTSAGGSAWSSAPIVLETEVDVDDISSIVAFGGDKIGVFWSDQSRDRFGFRVHHDGDPPDVWDATEVVFAEAGSADDHLNLGVDSRGRIFAVTKDARNQLDVHRRAVNGNWTTVRDVCAHTSNRGIIMVDDADQLVWVLYSNRSRFPATIEYRRADATTLEFGEPIEFISSTSDLDDVTGLKQPLPVGSLVVIATDADQNAWSNAFDPPDPSGLCAQRVSTGPGAEAPENGVELRWDEPGVGTPDRYRVYRRRPGTLFRRIDDAPVRENSYVDTNPPADLLCYTVTAMHGGIESAPTNESCIDLDPVDPSAPLRLQIYPNPFNPSTRVSFRLTQPSHVRIALHDARGRLIRTLASRMFAAGAPVVEWDGLDGSSRPVPAGTYLLSVRVDGHLETRQVTLLK
jgi:hypothetical protein